MADEPDLKLVVGLGNPGPRYDGTRHNVGFAVVDGLAQGSRAGSFRERFQADVAELIEGDQKVLLAKPQTFMNLSGRCVRQVVDFYKIPLENVLIVCDDVNLPLGKLRFRARGTHGGHNGLRDIQAHLGTTEYGRLRIGVGAPEGSGEMVDHVLGRFRPGEKPVIEEALHTAVAAVSRWLREGMAVCMNEYNG